jgi:hypothetical protein
MLVDLAAKRTVRLEQTIGHTVRVVQRDFVDAQASRRSLRADQEPGDVPLRALVVTAVERVREAPEPRATRDEPDAVFPPVDDSPGLHLLGLGQRIESFQRSLSPQVACGPVTERGEQQHTDERHEHERENELGA